MWLWWLILAYVIYRYAKKIILKIKYKKIVKGQYENTNNNNNNNNDNSKYTIIDTNDKGD